MATFSLEALSGICGSISIACWVVVFSPQIVENFRRSSAEGLSIVFIVVWLIGDVFNILGSVLQGVLPTMIILAVYYTLADIVLLLQCFYYRGFTLSDYTPTKDREDEPLLDEQSPLINRDAQNSAVLTPREEVSNPLGGEQRRGSFRDQLQHLDGTRLSPATPIHANKRDEQTLLVKSPVQKQRPLWKSLLFNLTAVLTVCVAGSLGWWLSTSSSHERHHSKSKQHHPTELHFNVAGQILGYICAVLYLGSRVPQLLLNYRRKSTEGISMLFFIFACLGNLTYDISILAFEPKCFGANADAFISSHSTCQPGEAAAIYWRHVLVNLSWLLGSGGTLLLDACVFIQYFIYKTDQPELEHANGEAED